jgi:DNA polymerase/3'-5' exonuclease PolX
MSGGIKQPHGKMHDLAGEFIKLLGDTCERIEIAGSIRRDVSFVGDIELVAVPSIVEERDGGLWPEPVNQLRKRLQAMAQTNVISPRVNKNGHYIAWLGQVSDPRYVALEWRGVPVDLFMVLPDRLDYFGYIYWLRTGPGDANRHMVTPAYERDGRRSGGLKPDRLEVKDGLVYRDGQPHPVPTEEAMFAALELAYVEPHLRSVSSYLQARKRWLRGRLAEAWREGQSNG